MSQLLFHQDAYMREFDATVTDAFEKGGLNIVTLSNTAFYYTSGGQPYDTGKIGGANVLDVYKENESGRILHVVDAPLENGGAVHCEIDWARRFDHMCQHAGEHLIAWAFFKKYGGMTIGLHLGSEASSIDVDMQGKPLKLSTDEIGEIEGMVMEKILENVPINCRFPSPDELNEIPLRKPPTVSENLRIVSIGTFEHVACGGTHPRSTGEIGLIKIIDAKPNRGKLRISFLCGMRAYKAFQLLQQQAEVSCALLSAKWENLSDHVRTVLEKQVQTETDMQQMQTRALLARTDELLSKARLCAEGRVVFCRFDAVCDQAMRELANALTAETDVAALLFSGNSDKGEVRTNAVFACGSEVPVHIGNLLREVFRNFGGKGGGKPNFAMGSLPESADLDAVHSALMRGFS